MTSGSPPDLSILPLKGPSACRYRLDDDSSDTCTLPDGRKLGYAQYGCLTGKAVFWIHGLPGSRTEGAYFHDHGIELGARIIATDRPGMGLSSPQPGRTLLDWSKDVEMLAAHLGLTEYSLLGASGAGPYLLACAAASPPEKLKSVAIICGLGPPDVGMAEADLVHRLGFPYGWRYAPVCLLRYFFRTDAFGRMELTDEERLRAIQSPEFLKSMTKKDLEVYKDEDNVRMMLRATREAWKQDFKWICQDGKLMCEPWPFRVEDIRHDLPIQLWYGKQDVHVPFIHAQQIAARLGGRAELHFEEETHASIFFNWKKEVLEGVLKDM